MRLRFLLVVVGALVAGEPLACVRAGDGSVNVGASIKRGVTSGGAFVCPAAALAPAVTALVTPENAPERVSVARASAVIALVCASVAAVVRSVTGVTGGVEVSEPADAGELHDAAAD